MYGFDRESIRAIEGHDPEESPNFIILVHGTFAHRASWVLDGSPLCAEIRARFPNARLLRFYWDGRNQFSSRRRAAVGLRKAIKGILTAWPESRVTVIAHSHGGSVGFYALNGLADVSRCSLACLSTPFIHVETRPSLTDIRFYGGLFFLLVFISITAVAMLSYLRQSSFDRSVIDSMADLATYLAFALPCLIVFAVTWSKSVKKMSTDFIRRNSRFCAFPRAGLRFHLYRLPSDEASLVLTFAQALETIVSSVIVGLDWLVLNAGRRSHGAIYKLPNWLTMGTWWLCWIIAAIWHGNSMLWWVLALFAVTTIGFLAPAMTFVMRLLLGSVVAILLCIGAPLYGFAYGRECSLLSVLLTVSCESAPLGSSSITYLGVGESSWRPVAGQLLHSSYNHPGVASLIGTDLLGDQ